MNFLLYIENSAENLQFYLWFRDYSKRFDELPEDEKKLSPEWVHEQPKAKVTQSKAISDVDISAEDKRKADAEVAAAIKGTDFDTKVKLTVTEIGHNPFNTPPRTPVGDRVSIDPSTSGWNEDSSTLMSSTATSHAKKAANAFETAQTLQPCRSAPVRSRYWSLMHHSHCSALQRGDLTYHRRIYCQ
jgi:hypothetical protein